MIASVTLERTHDGLCHCQRCTGFQPGNGVAARHGAYARLQLAPRAEEIAAEVREVVPVTSPADEPTISALSIVLAQLERASIVLDGARGGDSDGGDNFERLSRDARGWAGTALRFLDALGMTPVSRARLGLDLARTEDALAQLRDEGRAVRERREAALGG